MKRILCPEGAQPSRLLSEDLDFEFSCRRGGFQHTLSGHHALCSFAASTSGRAWWPFSCHLALDLSDPGRRQASADSSGGVSSAM